MNPDTVKQKEIKPAISGYIRESQSLLKKSSVPDEDTVHEIRILMKKSRAALKLTVSQIDKTSFDRDLSAFREIGRILSLWRELSVQRKTLKELRKEHPGIFFKLRDYEKLTSILKKMEPVPELFDELKAGLEQINNLLWKAGFRIRFQSMKQFDPQLFLHELEMTYNKTFNIYLKCRNNPQPETLHELRKKAKDFLYQLSFFRSLNPTVIKSLEKRLDVMTWNIGKINDLTQVVRTLGYDLRDSSNLPSLNKLIIKIREKQDRYLNRVWPSAYKIFCPGQSLPGVLGINKNLK
jgi:CHAD domain-containing protein